MLAQFNLSGGPRLGYWFLHRDELLATVCVRLLGVVDLVELDLLRMLPRLLVFRYVLNRTDGHDGQVLSGSVSRFLNANGHHLLLVGAANFCLHDASLGVFAW